MQVIVQGQHLEIGEALRLYVTDKLDEHCTKYFSHTIQGNVHFAREANGYRTEITLTVGNGVTLSASANDPADPYPAFDAANTKLLSQLRKYKDKMRDHRATAAKEEIADGLQQAATEVEGHY